MSKESRWTPKREKLAVRDKRGRFLYWKGGKSIKSYSKKWRNNNAHGNRVHIGQVWSKQHNRPPRIGDCVRTKRKDGRFHKLAQWYVRTRHGWRDSGSTTKPLPATIKRICANARPTRRR